MTVGVPQAPWEYSLRWAAWLAHRQIEKGWLEVHLDIKKREIIASWWTAV